MARWEPNARERLVRAAVDLFAEQGYDATTVNEIAERAGGLTKTTFFRHFADKREVLFAGQELHSRVLAEAIAAAPESASPLEAVGAAVFALTDTFTEDRREMGRQLLVVIGKSAELQERAAYKRSVLADAMDGALRERGVAEPAASVAADLGVRAFGGAFARWTGSADGRALAEFAGEELARLRGAITELGWHRESAGALDGAGDAGTAD
ncbi:MAG TPA: helix-turn-helix domain-containing protein [Actinospica sp.]|nr:helix-turn-helix domain-containing protein [Actinospica sp.]